MFHRQVPCVETLVSDIFSASRKVVELLVEWRQSEARVTQRVVVVTIWCWASEAMSSPFDVKRDVALGDRPVGRVQERGGLLRVPAAEPVGVEAWARAPARLGPGQPRVQLLQRAGQLPAALAQSGPHLGTPVQTTWPSCKLFNDFFYKTAACVYYF